MVDDNPRYRLNQNKLIVGLLNLIVIVGFPNRNLYGNAQKAFLAEVQVTIPNENVTDGSSSNYYNCI